MIGHEHLKALRRGGVAPEWVGVSRIPTWGPDGAGAWIYIQPADNLDRLDLRCLTGLRVEVWSEDLAEPCSRFAKETYIAHSAIDMELFNG